MTTATMPIPALTAHRSSTADAARIRVVPSGPLPPSGRVFFRPRSVLFWTYLAIVGYGVLKTALWLGPLLQAAPGIGWLGVTGGIVLAVALLWLIRRLDVFGARTGLAPLFAAGLVWGGFAATALAVGANGHVEGWLAKVTDPHTASAWNAALAGPLDEEWLKTAGVLAVLLIGRAVIRRPVHGFLVGALTGLGFQLVENLSYALNTALSNPDSDLAGALPTLLLRSVLGIGSHWLYSGLAGLGVGYALTRLDLPKARRWTVAAGLIGLAWGMHFLWNSPLVTDWLPGSAALLGSALKLALILAAFVLVYRRMMRQEWHTFASTLARHAPFALAAGDLAAMRTRRRRRQARREAARRHGPGFRRWMRDVQRAQVGLAVAYDTADASAVLAGLTELRRLRGPFPTDPVRRMTAPF